MPGASPGRAYLHFMPCRTLLVAPRLLVVRFCGLVPEDLRRLRDEVRAAGEAAGGSIYLVGIFPEDTAPPPRAARQVLDEVLSQVLRQSELHGVLEGCTFKTRILRSLLTNLFLRSQCEGPLFVYRSAEEAVIAVGPKLRLGRGAVRQLLERLRREGMVAGEALAAAGS